MKITRLLKRPGAFAPLVMSLAALTVVAGHLALNGAAPQPDEGAAAHLWQLLMAGQVPIIALFAARWLPEDPVPASQILALQLAAGVAAAAPVFLLGF